MQAKAEETPKEIGVAPENSVANAGATVRPNYVERNPTMWAVGETDMRSLTALALGANISFSFSGFCVGCISNIVISYGGAEKLTEIASFMLYRGCFFIGLLAVAGAMGGIAFTRSKNSIWEQIKRETKRIS